MFGQLCCLFVVVVCMCWVFGWLAVGHMVQGTAGCACRSWLVVVCLVGAGVAGWVVCQLCCLFVVVVCICWMAGWLAVGHCSWLAPVALMY